MVVRKTSKESKLKVKGKPKKKHRRNKIKAKGKTNKKFRKKTGRNIIVNLAAVYLSMWSALNSFSPEYREALEFTPLEKPRQKIQRARYLIYYFERKRGFPTLADLDNVYRFHRHIFKLLKNKKSFPKEIKEFTEFLKKRSLELSRKPR